MRLFRRKRSSTKFLHPLPKLVARPVRYMSELNLRRNTHGFYAYVFEPSKDPLPYALRPHDRKVGDE